MTFPTLTSFTTRTKAKSAEVNANFLAIKNAIGKHHTVTNASYTITDTDAVRVLYMSTGNSDRIAAPPAAADNDQRIITIMKIDSGTGRVDVDPTENVNGEASTQLNAQYDYITIQSNGTEWYVIGSSSATGGGGAGRINYAELSDKAWDMETNISGYSTYDDGATATPVNGTGGTSSNLTLSRNTTTPLNGSADLKCAKAAADSQGEGFSIDVNIPSGYQNGWLSEISILMDFTAMGAAGDWVVYAYDVTNSTLLTPRDTALPKFKGLWSTDFGQPATCTQLRLIFHCATTSTSAYNVFVDDVIIGPGNSTRVVNPVSEEMDQTDAITGGGTATFTYSERKYWQVGPMIGMRWRVAVTGNGSGSSSITIPFPSGLTGFGATSNGGESNFGSWYKWNGSAFVLGGFLRLTDGSSAVGLSLVDEGTATLVKGSDLVSGDIYYIEALAPIEQWTGSAYASSNRVEYASNDGSGGTTAGASYDTGMVYGPSGSQLVSVASTTADSATRYRVRFQYNIQDTDDIKIEFYQSPRWGVGNICTTQRILQSTSQYGMWYEPISGSNTDIYVCFGNKGARPSNSTYAGDGAAWSTFAGSSTFKWRVRKVSGAKAYYQGATSSQMGLVKGGEVPGQTSGATVASGYLGEVISGTNGSGALTSGVAANFASISLTAGIWILYGTAQATCSGTPGANGYSDFSFSATSATVDASKGFQRNAITTVAGYNVLNSPGSIVVNVSSTTTYYLVGRLTFTTATFSINSSSTMTAVRIG